MDRQIIHLHIPAFSIAVARVCQPGLRDRPVAVAPPQSERALVLSVSSEARREGVYKGIPLGKALKLCPHLRVLRPDPGLLERACRALGRVVGQYTPLWEPSRPGHVYLDLTGTERLWGRAKDTAYRLRKEIKDRVSLPGMVGVAGNKMVSSIASRIMSEAAGVLDVDHGREAAFMAPLGVNMVPGIGRFYKKILLEELSIIRVRELADLEMGPLRLVFGRQAYVIHQRALGIDPTPVYTAPMRPQVSEEIVFSPDENDDRKLMAALYTLVEKCALRMRGRALFPQRAGVLVRYSDQVEVRRQFKLSCRSFWDFDLYGPLEQGFLKTCARRVRVRFMRIWFWEFSRDSGQLSLFHDESRDTEKQKMITQAMDRIRERHGRQAVGYGKTTGIRYTV